jgi:L-threonylcarbamoyladenylate synthase
MSAALTAADAAALADCIEGGGVAVFPADTVYGLACDPQNADAVARLYELKGRPPDKPAAVMWFDRDAALAALPELGARTRSACERLLPGGVTLLLPNQHGRFPLAAGSAGERAATDDERPAGEGTGERSVAAGRAGAGPALGMRVPASTGPFAALAGLSVAVLQSSANHAGGPDARTLDEVPEAIRAGADLVLGAGPLPGTPSTVIDLRTYEDTGDWSIVREGAVAAAEVARTLGIVGRL